MKLVTKNLIIFLALAGALPCMAKIEGNVSQTNFYDTEKTLMTQVTADTALKTDKYWEKNLFYINKYRPLFMLSNKDLYSLAPEKKTNVFQRVSAPMIYNVSLKDPSINIVSLSAHPKKTVANSKAPAVAKSPKGSAPECLYKTPSLELKQDLQSKFLFEQAKNQGVDSDKKIETALVLKKTGKPANYLLALDLLEDVTRVEPYNAAAFNLKAEIYLKKNDREGAMKNYIAALNLNPYSKESCLGIAKILESTNKPLSQKYYDRARQ